MDITDIIRLVVINNRINEELLYTIVYDELSDNNMSRGLWLKALTETEGDTERAKYIYVKYRVQAIKDEISINKIEQEKEAEQLKKEADYVAKTMLCYTGDNIDKALSGDKQACYSLCLQFRSRVMYDNAYFWAAMADKTKYNQELKPYMTKEQIETAEMCINIVRKLGGLHVVKQLS